MNNTHRKTLERVLADPVSGNLEWSRIEAMLKAGGCRVVEGAGSAVTFEFGGRRLAVHRPHPGKEALRYRVSAVCEFVEWMGLEAMTNAMTYNGYTASMTFDVQDKVIVGRVLDIDDVIVFHGESVAEFESRFHAAVDAYVAASNELGSPPEKPASGNVMLRIAPEVHAAALKAAAQRHEP